MKDHLIARLHWGFLKKPDGGHYPVNPDGPEAANEIERLRAENARLREALTFYGGDDPNNMDLGDWEARMIEDAGDVARAALAEQEKDQ